MSAHFSACVRIIILCTTFLSVKSQAQIAGYVHTALSNFSPEVPKHWAYSLTTERDDRKITEHFDPAKPPTGQWTLLRTGGRAPTAGEAEKYIRYKSSQSPGPMQATFQKNDIEPGSLKLVREDSERADFTCTFRELSANADKMLGHLGLLLTIDKRLSYVEKFRLTLNAPYSPVLTVKMNELVVTMDFSPPNERGTSLPSQSSSHFAGRIFFVPVEENITYHYSDFTFSP
jgi:hypothetical protein